MAPKPTACFPWQTRNARARGPHAFAPPAAARHDRTGNTVLRREAALHGRRWHPTDRDHILPPELL
eukprot:1939123-Lingulodinium_polyedra.AAC.1